MEDPAAPQSAVGAAESVSAESRHQPDPTCSRPDLPQDGSLADDIEEMPRVSVSEKRLVRKDW